MDFKGKTAVITGASDGIGKATAIKLAELGCNLLLIARNIEKLNSVTDEIKSTYPKCKIIPYKCDVSKSEEVATTFNNIKEKFKTLDFLINSAGISSSKPIETITNQDFNNEIDINLKGTYYCIMNAYPLMKSGGEL
jgi:3-oxoacyl-[acyl-carrier protein] reductase